MTTTEAPIDRPLQDLNWDDLTFSITPTRSMWLMECDKELVWNEGQLEPFRNLQMSPAAGVLNYGQGAFEGMKAYHTEKNRIVLFRPEKNSRRFVDSATRLCMPPIPEDKFIEGVEAVVRDNADFVPPCGKGSLYIRPILWGSGPVLGVKPAPWFSFLIYASPVGLYFKGGLRCLNLKVSHEFHRAAPHGTGNAKAIGNYAASLYPLMQAKEEGYDEVIYLKADNEELVEEVGAANIFAVKGNKMVTPRLGGSILPGVTRDSVLIIAGELMGMVTEERDVTLEEVLEADEVFCTGTAAVVMPIGKITDRENTMVYCEEQIGPVARELYNTLTGIQKEKIEDSFGWLRPVLVI
jgi:branched-chain amino acid aminotransferase